VGIGIGKPLQSHSFAINLQARVAAFLGNYIILEKPDPVSRYISLTTRWKGKGVQTTHYLKYITKVKETPSCMWRWQ